MGQTMKLTLTACIWVGRTSAGGGLLAFAIAVTATLCCGLLLAAHLRLVVALPLLWPLLRLQACRLLRVFRRQDGRHPEGDAAGAL